MAVDRGLVTLLAAEATITALTTRGAAGVYNGYAPQEETGTYVEVHTLNTDYYKTLGTTTGMRSSDLDIDCKAKTRAAAEALANAVETYIKDYAGAAGSDTINAVLMNDRAVEVEPPDGARQYARFTETLDLQVQWTPA